MTVWFNINSGIVVVLFASNSLKMPVLFDVSSGKVCSIVLE